MDSLYLRKEGVSRRQSSWDQTGGNKDHVTIKSNQTQVIATINGSGIIQHIWCTIASRDHYSFRKILVRMYWDGETEPSVESPIGDFLVSGMAWRVTLCRCL